jgi:DNA transformation protein
MTASPGFAEFIRDALGPIGRLTLRRMFGATGVFCDGLMFAMIADDTIYFRVDDGNRQAFEAAAHDPPLSYEKGGKRIDLAFWRAPDRLLDDPEALLAWGRLALAAAGRVAAGRRPPIGRAPATPA